MADIEEETQQVDIPEDSDQKSWSASQTRMLITHFEENPILWDKRLKDSANKQKTKKAMAPLIGRFEMTLPQRNPKEIKSRWHGLRSSLLRNMKKKKVDPDCEIKWAFWKDLEFIRLSLEMEEGNEDHVEWSNEETEHFIEYYQANSSLWNHNEAEYHTNSNKDILVELLCKELNDTFTPEDIEKKWKSLVKKFKQEFAKATKKPPGSGTKDIYKSNWEFYAQLQFIHSICDDTAETVDSLTGPSEIKSRKSSRLMQRDEREEKKLQLFARAVDAMQTPPPSACQMPLADKKEPLAFTNYVALSLSKLSPALYRRAKKRISDVLYEMEEQNDIEPGRCNVNDNISQYDTRQSPSTFNSNFLYADNNYGRPPSASLTTSNQFYQGPNISSGDQPLRSCSPLAFDNSQTNQRVYHDLT